MNRFPVIISLLLLLAWVGCSSNLEKPDMGMMAREVAADAKASDGEASAEDQEIQVVERKLIKEGTVVFESDGMDSTRRTIMQALAAHKGYVSSDQAFRSDGRMSNTIVIRVPTERFDQFLMDATKGVDKLDRKEIAVRDVTEEFLDLEARLHTKKELEKRYLELLTKARTIAEMLEIERQVGELRSDIESVEGRLKYLGNRVSLSTLTLTFYEVVSNDSGVARSVRSGFKNGWEGLVEFFILLVNIWPVLLGAIGVFVAVRVIRRKGRS